MIRQTVVCDVCGSTTVSHTSLLLGRVHVCAVCKDSHPGVAAIVRAVEAAKIERCHCSIGHQYMQFNQQPQGYK